MQNTESSRFAPMLQALESGSLTPSQLSAVSQALHVGMLNSALEAIKESDELLGSLKHMEDAALGFLEERFQEALPTMSYESILEFLGAVSEIRTKSVNTKLKVYSTRDLFNVNPISEDDRALLGLLRLVGSQGKKERLSAFIRELTADDNIINVPSKVVVETPAQLQ